MQGTSRKSSCSAQRITYFHTVQCTLTHSKQRGWRCFFDFKNKNSPERAVPWDRSQQCNKLRLVFLAFSSVGLVRRVIATQSGPNPEAACLCVSSGRDSFVPFYFLSTSSSFSSRTYALIFSTCLFDTLKDDAYDTHEFTSPFCH